MYSTVPRSFRESILVCKTITKKIADQRQFDLYEFFNMNYCTLETKANDNSFAVTSHIGLGWIGLVRFYFDRIQSGTDLPELCRVYMGTVPTSHCTVPNWINFKSDPIWCRVGERSGVDLPGPV